MIDALVGEVVQTRPDPTDPDAIVRHLATGSASTGAAPGLVVFPELAQTPITHYWHGQTGFTFDMLPHLGEHEGLFYTCSYNGTGIAHASWFGHKIAQRALGITEEPSAYADLPLVPG